MVLRGVIKMTQKFNPQEMCIYEKLSHIQVELLNYQIKKSGWNPWGGFAFFELKDLLPPVLRLCEKYHCTPIFSFEMDYGFLFIKDWNSNECIKITSPLPTLEKLPKMNLVQANGTYQTYSRRYLLLSAFGIVEPELIDSLNMEELEILDKKPESINKVIDAIREENPDAEITNEIINKKSMKMYQNKKLTDGERKEIFNWYKEAKKKGK